MFILLRKPEVLISQAIKKSTLHNRIKEGLFVPPVSIGVRAVAWPQNEVESITSALIAGKTPDQIRELVKDLMKKRTEGGRG